MNILKTEINIVQGRNTALAICMHVYLEDRVRQVRVTDWTHNDETAERWLEHHKNQYAKADDWLRWWMENVGIEKQERLY